MDEVYLGQILNSYRIFYPSVVYKLIQEFNQTTIIEKCLTYMIEEFLFQKIIVLYKEYEKKFSNLLYKSDTLTKDYVLSIIYSYNISLDKLLLGNVREINKFINFLEKGKIHSNNNSIGNKKMKRIEISFIPSFQKINKIYLGFSILIWMILYIIIFYFIYK